ncbi:MAG: hypothetical protein WBV11_16165 [Salegentibacter sp.]
MKTTDKNFRYIEWKSPEEMHYSSLQWLSEMEFVQDEHYFFEDMLKEYTLPIIESQLLSEVKGLIDKLSQSKTKAEKLMKKIREHNNGLDIMVDGKDQPKEEKEYKIEHRQLLKEFNVFSREYQDLKKEVFETVSKAMKKQKQKRLLT